MEKRLQRRAEKAETSKMKAVTATTVTPKQKVKTDPEWPQYRQKQLT